MPRYQVVRTYTAITEETLYVEADSLYHAMNLFMDNEPDDWSVPDIVDIEDMKIHWDTLKEVK